MLTSIDLIAKDVLICDWHYERADQTPVLFAMKGLSMVTCLLRKPDLAVKQAQDMFRFRQQATTELKDCYQEMMQTVWSGASSFLDEFYGKKADEAESQSACFKALFTEINEVSTAK